MGDCSSNNCNPCGPDYNAINQLATKTAAYARQANTYSVDAANSAQNAQNSFLEFNALYLGAFAVAPTADNEGNPLQTGALYWNSVTNEMFVWNGSAWTPDAFNQFTNFTATGTTTARNLVTRMADVVNVKDFGAVGDGVADDTAAIQAALASAKFGQTIFIPSDCRCLITSTITIPKGSSLISDSTGWKGYAANRGNDGLPDFYDIGPALHLSSSAKIALQTGASIKNLIIIRTGMTFPVTYTQASTWTGNAIESSRDNVSISNCTIFGFRAAIAIVGQRPLITQNNIDCWNGLDVSSNYDVGMISENHLWPFLSAYWRPVATTNDLKRDVGINLHDVSDWTQLSNNFCYGYRVGFRLVNVGAISIVNCAADNIPPAQSTYYAGSFGFYFENCSKTKVSNCNVAAQDIGISVNNAATDISFNNCNLWANISHGILLNSGFIKILNTEIEGRSNSIHGITYNDSTSASLLLIDKTSIIGYNNSGQIPINTNQNVQTYNLQIQNVSITQSNNPYVSGSGLLSTATVSSAGSMIIPAQGPNNSTFFVIGNTNIGNFTGVTWSGRTITLVFSNALILVNSTALRLQDSINAVVTPYSSMTFTYVAGSWVEVSRSIK